MSAILIIGEDPKSLKPSDNPPGVTAETILKGLTDARDALRAKGHEAEILLTTSVDKIEGELSDAVRARRYDVLVIGAGLRVLPPMAQQFERLMNAIRVYAPHARLAFNSKPDDSADAALRQLA
jgi:hypothetical protein